MGKVRDQSRAVQVTALRELGPEEQRRKVSGLMRAFLNNVEDQLVARTGAVQLDKHQLEALQIMLGVLDAYDAVVAELRHRSAGSRAGL